MAGSIKRKRRRLSSSLTLKHFPVIRYSEADKHFEENIEDLDKGLPEGRDKREKVIRSELAELEKIVAKLGEEYVSIMHRSMKSFKEHVSKSHHNVLVDFIFPMPIKGLTV